jgi:hypothetical protein
MEAIRRPRQDPVRPADLVLVGERVDVNIPFLFPESYQQKLIRFGRPKTMVAKAERP